MKNQLVAYVGWLLLAAALGFYCYGIADAIILSGSGQHLTKEDYPEFLLSTIGSIQALLLANLGIVLGISVANPQSGLARQLMLSSATERFPELADPIELRTKIQLFAMVIYIFSLVACLITWIIKGFSVLPEEVISLIPESGRMFAGVVLAYLTVILGIKRN